MNTLVGGGGGVYNLYICPGSWDKVFTSEALKAPIWCSRNKKKYFFILLLGYLIHEFWMWSIL